MDYTTLIGDRNTSGSIANWMNDSRIPAVADDIIGDAFGNICMRLRHWRMQTTPTPVTVAAGVDSVVVPDDFIEPAFLTYAGDGPPLEMSTIEEVVSRFAYVNNVKQAGRPTRYCLLQEELVFDTKTDQQYLMLMSYYQRPTALSSESTTNWLTRLYPRLVRTALMISAAEWMKDSGQGNFDRTYWTVVFQDQLNAAQIDSDRSKRALVARPVIMR